MGAPAGGDEAKSPLKEITQPFVDLVHAPRALWGINIAYVLEGLVYFGMLGYLAMHFSDFIFQGVEHADEWSHNMVMVLTAGITLSMIGLGWVCDKWGVRKALLTAFVFLLAGRIVISAAPTLLGMEPAGLGSALHLTTMGGILLVVIGYGMYQPSAYAAVRQFTTPKTAAMGFAMLYALMNLGGWLVTFGFLLRDDKPFEIQWKFIDFSIPCLGLGITGTYWVYTSLTVVALISTIILLSRKTVANAIKTAKEETARIKAEEDSAKSEETKAEEAAEKAEAAAARLENIEILPWYVWVLYLAIIGAASTMGEMGGFYIAGLVIAERTAFSVLAMRGAAKIERTGESLGRAGEPQMFPLHVWLLLAGIVIAIFWRIPAPYAYYIGGAVIGMPLVLRLLPEGARDGALGWIGRHPLADAKFFYFIFALIPVQTLFTYNWLVLPQYINRAFDGWIGEKFEIAANLNPILIFIAVPIIAAVTRKANVFNMMIWGTLVMAAPAFLLAIGAYWWTLFPYIFIMTIGEAMWQPRFLQYAAEIAPEGRTGEYMGVAQLPWFLTKMLAPLLLTGWAMDRYCPVEGEADTRTMWFVFATIAMLSTFLLIVAKGWIGRDFKTKAD